MVKEAGCGRNIADLAAYVSLSKINAPGEAALSGHCLWPWFGLKMEENTTAWLQLKPANTSLVVLRLDSLEALFACPDFAPALQAQHILSKSEWARLCSFSHKKRRLEWLGGRMAAKYALQQFSSLYAPDTLPADIVIENDQHGRPLVQAACLTIETHISISHSGRFAAALIASNPCGLDVQEAVAKLRRLQTRFADSAELALYHGYDELSWLAMLWAAKEAIKKCRYADQATFMERIRVRAHEGCATEPQGAVLSCGLQDEEHLVPVRVVLRQGYAMAVSMGEDHA